MNASDISDGTSLETWLETRPVEDAVAIAARASLRVAPLVWKELSPVSNNALGSVAPILWSASAALTATCQSGAMVISAASAASARFENGEPMSQYWNVSNPAWCAIAPPIDTAGDAAGMVDDAAKVFIAAYVTGEDSEFWSSIRADAAGLEESRKVLQTPLWSELPSPDPVWRKVKDAWVVAGEDWDFWIRWYDAILIGEPLLATWDAHWAMIEQIALIAPKTWNAGPAAVADAIRKIEREFQKPVRKPAPSTVREAVNRNAETLPAQLEALFETIDAEIERLRGKNPKDDMEAQDAERLKSIFQKMRGVVGNLAALLPDTQPIDDVKAEEVGSLLSVFAAEFRKWPRENAADLVDGTYRVTLVGLTAGLMATCGVPWLAGVAAGGLVFGGKRLADMRNAAKSFNSDG